MACVLETLTVPRASAVPSTSLTPVTGASSSRRSSNRFSQFRGLKIQQNRCALSLSSTSKIARRGSQIVCEAQETAFKVAEVTEAAWDSLVLGSSSPVLVEFWAPWCGPCHESPSIATKYGIRSIPTVMIFKNGEKKDFILFLRPNSVSDSLSGLYLLIFSWLYGVQSSSLESDDKPKCPICKAYITTSSLVPLYGRGTSSAESDGKKCQLDLVIPHRPVAHGMNSLLPSNQQLHPNPFQPQQPSFHHSFDNYAPMTPSSFGGTTTTNFFNPTIHMFGEMVFARIFGSSEASLFSYPRTNSYPIMANGSPRLRRQEMQVDKSLNRLDSLTNANSGGGHRGVGPNKGKRIKLEGVGEITYRVDQLV
ncbi:unnamed protein product [Fraxinus pennsylvanica]|uniref:Thioredoxin domain-containing protein n=1 Tax=Fraxinus pennsylvanica TaxID=56036 RepID=A0AAD2DQQ3_9LAMI|nr:unnamed protein product [Fraxinus pennsylvanica]